MGVRTIPVTVPDPVWFRLASLAEKEDTTVPALMAAGIASIVDPPGRRKQNREVMADRLRVMKKRRDQGWSWPRIAAELDISMSTLYAFAHRNGMTRSSDG